jgi:hypothetical protein
MAKTTFIFPIFLKFCDKYILNRFSNFFSDWMEVQEKLKEIVNGTIDELLQPTENNLTPRSD